jgi:hypothetical protein
MMFADPRALRLLSARPAQRHCSWQTGSGYMIAAYIALCAIVSIAATIMMPDYTSRDISREHA